MPDRIAQDLPALETPALQTLAEIANDNIAQAGSVGGSGIESRRLEAAARILLAARRVRALVGTEPTIRAQASEPSVDSLAAAWDPRALTALEYAESLPVRSLDGLLRAAPRWAVAMRDLLGPHTPGAAAA
jgi:hypothetical protein